MDIRRPGNPVEYQSDLERQAQERYQSNAAKKQESRDLSAHVSIVCHQQALKNTIYKSIRLCKSACCTVIAVLLAADFVLKYMRQLFLLLSSAFICLNNISYPLILPKAGKSSE